VENVAYHPIKNVKGVTFPDEIYLDGGIIEGSPVVDIGWRFQKPEPDPVEWTHTHRSALKALVEQIMPGVVATNEPTREVIDGQQRLRTVLAYVNPSLLKDFDPIRDDFKIKSSHNRELADKDFASLTPDLQKAILECQFDVHFPHPTSS